MRGESHDQDCARLFTCSQTPTTSVEMNVNGLFGFVKARMYTSEQIWIDRSCHERQGRGFRSRRAARHPRKSGRYRRICTESEFAPGGEERSTRAEIGRSLCRHRARKVIRGQVGAVLCGNQPESIKVFKPSEKTGHDNHLDRVRDGFGAAEEMQVG